MSATSVGSHGIVHEVLTKENYEEWSVLVKNYLMGQGLWDVVESNAEIDEENIEEYEAWKRQNARALHIIQLSCDSEVLSQIKQVETAKEAWNCLKASFGADLQAIPDIEQGVADDSLQLNRRLHRYVESGNWAAARSFIDSDSTALFSTSSWGRTVLHVAVIAGHEDIVSILVKQGEERLLRMQDCRGYTALALAADLTGNTNIAECMVQKCGDLVAIRTKDGQIPVLVAAANGDKQMTRYLFRNTPRGELVGENIRNGVLLLTRCVAAEIFDVALSLLRLIPELLQTDESNVLQSLNALAHMPSAFLSGSRFGCIQQFFNRILILGPIWSEADGITKEIVRRVATDEGQGLRRNSIAYRLLRSVQLFFQNSILLHLPGMRKIYDKKLTHHIVLLILSCFCQRISSLNEAQLQNTCAYGAMLQAAKYGIIEFIHAIRQANPDLLWAIDKNKRGIFSHAVLNRRKEVFQLIHGINGRKEIIKTRADTFGNNLLHLAGHLGPSSELDRSSGAALQMQRELQWFEAVERLVHPKCKETKNKDGKKPREVFTEQHAELVKAGEKWAKDTASSFILVGILITTIMFAAAFTVPGGDDPKTGIPSLSHNRIFDVFAVADAASLFTSTASVLVFIGILTSRYAENDFRYSLPWKLMLGLVTLFSSVVAMLIAFCAAVGMMLKGYPQGTVRTILGLASIPVIVLVPMQLRLFLQFFGSTIWPILKEVGFYLLGILFKCFGRFPLRKKRSSWMRTLSNLDV